MKEKTVLRNIVNSQIKDIYEIKKEEEKSGGIPNSLINEEDAGYDEVIRPKHYCNTAYQPVYVIEDWAKSLPPDEVFAFGNALKYIKRYRDKGSPVKDIDKAIWYLIHLKEILKHKERNSNDGNMV